MSLQAALYSELTANSNITGIVSTRIYPLVAPESVSMPFVTYQKISNNHAHTQAAASGRAQATIQITAWAATAKGAEELATAIREAMDGMNHATIGSGDNMATVQAIMLETDFEDYEPPRAAYGQAVYSQKLEFRIWYTESVPTFA